MALRMISSQEQELARQRVTLRRILEADTMRMRQELGTQMRLVRLRREAGTEERWTAPYRARIRELQKNIRDTEYTLREEFGLGMGRRRAIQVRGHARRR